MKRIRASLAIQVAMIALAALIVVTHAADASHHIGEPVLVAMRTARDGLRNFPHNQLSKAGADYKPGSRDSIECLPAQGCSTLYIESSVQHVLMI